eukprot:CAMPEP_0170436520 /NCGR_PEP_ID=MMETSP0117_2-20130122/44186_1 /TAXON_ID=400756 /ORGANISM="Durinskia baltica, Strain CSIRO CS-38" /LENGTH=67 /DNA_ID=CAMNT_0010696563 /DNA_START=359 /DNA_END=562 /DNA_ORIENTATION=+
MGKDIGNAYGVVVPFNIGTQQRLCCMSSKKAAVTSVSVLASRLILHTSKNISDFCRNNQAKNKLKKL